MFSQQAGFLLFPALPEGTSSIHTYSKHIHNHIPYMPLAPLREDASSPLIASLSYLPYILYCLRRFKSIIWHLYRQL